MKIKLESNTPRKDDQIKRYWKGVINRLVSTICPEVTVKSDIDEQKRIVEVAVYDENAVPVSRFTVSFDEINGRYGVADSIDDLMEERLTSIFSSIEKRRGRV